MTNREYCITNEDGSKRIETESDLVRARRPGSVLSMFMELKRKAPARVAGALGEDIQICPQCGSANYKTDSSIRKTLKWYVQIFVSTALLEYLSPFLWSKLQRSYFINLYVYYHAIVYPSISTMLQLHYTL